VYLTSSEIDAKDIMGITLTGKRGQLGTYGTRIKGAHTGNAIVSLVGSIFVTWNGIELEGDSTSIPKTGLLLGRASSASAGQHKFYGLKIYGTFSIAGYYNVASEDNEHYGTYIYVNSPICAAHLSQEDEDSIGGLTGSSMEKEKWFGGNIANMDNTATSTSLRIHAGSSTGNFMFDGTLIGKTGGDSFIEIKIDTDGSPTTMPITLRNVFGESTGTNPDNGIHFKTQSASSQAISGLTLDNVRFQSVDHYIFFDNNGTADAPGTGYTHFVGANISTPYWAAGAKPSVFYGVDKSKLSLLGESAITITTAYDNDISAYVVPAITTNVNNIIYGPDYSTVMNGGFSEPCLAVANVSFGADGVTALYTVPSGRRLVLTKVVVVVGADAGGTTVAISGPDVADDFLSAQTLSNLDAQYDAAILQPVPNATPVKLTSYAAGKIIYATVGSHAGGATNTFYVFGILY